MQSCLEGALEREIEIKMVHFVRFAIPVESLSFEATTRQGRSLKCTGSMTSVSASTAVLTCGSTSQICLITFL